MGESGGNERRSSAAMVTSTEHHHEAIGLGYVYLEPSSQSDEHAWRVSANAASVGTMQLETGLALR